MGMQTDVKSAQLTQSGFLYAGRTRLRQITYSGTAGQSGTLSIFDTSTAPIAAVYARSGTTVTVTKSAHGLSTGNSVGISFATAAGVSATPGNYSITVVDANTFTLIDPNTGSVSGGTACAYVVSNATNNTWVTGFNTLTGATGSQQIPIPGEGVLVQNGIYAALLNVAFITVFYG